MSRNRRATWIGIGGPLQSESADFRRLHQLTEARATFVTRAKRKLKWRRRYSHPVDRTAGLICDQTIVLTGTRSTHDYPAPLRRVSYRDPETGKKLDFLTNDFCLPPLTIAELYRLRWQVELFFKWIKQHLRIKSFFGESPSRTSTLEDQLHSRDPRYS